MMGPDMRRGRPGQSDPFKTRFSPGEARLDAKSGGTLIASDADSLGPPIWAFNPYQLERGSLAFNKG